MKIQKIVNSTSPFAGIFFSNAIFNNCRLSQLIDKKLGVRATSTGYLYCDIIMKIIGSFTCEKKTMTNN